MVGSLHMHEHGLLYWAEPTTMTVFFWPTYGAIGIVMGQSDLRPPEGIAWPGPSSTYGHSTPDEAHAMAKIDSVM